MSSLSPVAAVLEQLPGVRGWQEDFYRDLHAHPDCRTRSRPQRRKSPRGCGIFAATSTRTWVAPASSGCCATATGRYVLLRADMDALPVREATGVPYASTAVAVTTDGVEVPVMHACGHDVHVACLLGAVELLAGSTTSWAGTVAAVFQPAEEVADGARGMVEGGLAELVGRVGCGPGPTRPAVPGGTGRHPLRANPVLGRQHADHRARSRRARVDAPGRRRPGGPGRLDRRAPADCHLSGGAPRRARGPHHRQPSGRHQEQRHPGPATILLNVRTYGDSTRSAILAAIERMVTAECSASGSPRPPEFELFEHFPLTDNDAEVTARVAAAFTEYFGDLAVPLPLQTAVRTSATSRPHCRCRTPTGASGASTPTAYRRGRSGGRVAQDIPVNHSAAFAPVLQPTLETGTAALVVAAMAWLGQPPDT